MQTASPEVLIGAMAVLGLTAIGLLIWLLRYVVRGQDQNGKKSTQAPSSESDAASPASPATDDLPRPAAPQTTSTAGHSSSADLVPPPAAAAVLPPREPTPEPGDTLLMRILQDRDGYLVVEVEGQRYRRLFDIHDGAIGRWALEIINRLVAFSKGQETREVAPPPFQPSEKTAQQPSPAPAAAATSPDTIVEEQSETYLQQLKQKEETAPKKTRISTDPVPLRRRSEARERSITLNLAGEIDALLQIRVKAAPEFGQRYIHVASTPDGGLRFDVDGARYSGLDEIPDPQVQALIRAAIADWEAKR